MPLLLQRGYLAAARDDSEGALVAFGRVLEHAPDDADAHLGKMMQLRMLGRLEEAEHALAEAEARLGETVPLLLQRGYVAEARDDREGALASFEQALALASDNPDAHLAKVIELRVLGRLEEAEKALAEAEARLGESVPLLLQRGYVAEARDDREGALAAFEQALALAPDEANAHLAKVIELRVLGRREDALQALEQAEARLGRSASLLLQRALLAEARDDREGALAACEEALTLAPDDPDAHLGRVIELRVLGRHEEALQALEQARAAIGETPSLLVQGALLADAKYDFDRALDLSVRAVSLDPTNIDAHVVRLHELRQCRRYAEGERALDEIPPSLAGHPLLLSEAGFLAADDDRLDEAIERFREAEAADPSFPDPLLGQLDVFTRQRRFAESDRLVERLHEQFPVDLQVRESLGWLAAGRGDLSEAEREFRFILEADPTAVAGLSGLGGIYFRRAQYEFAEGQFREALKEAEGDLALETRLAWTLTRQGSEDQLAEAEQRARKALRSAVHSHEAYGCLGVIAFKRGNLRESEEHLLASIQIDDKKGSHGDLGALYVQMGRYEEAETQLKRAIELDSNDLPSRVELGALYFEMDRPASGVRELRHATALDPYNEEAIRGLAIALRRVGEPGAAERVLRSALRTLDERKTWRLHLTLSQMLTERGDDANDDEYYKEALKHVAKAKLLQPRDPDPHFHSGVIRAKLAEYWQAWRDFSRCVDLAPHDYEATRYRDQLRSKILSSVIRSTTIGSASLAVLSISQLILVWILYLRGSVGDSVLLGLTPILLGLFIIAFLLPSLVRLKLPGLEADVSGRRDAISSGPGGGDFSFRAMEGAARRPPSGLEAQRSEVQTEQESATAAAADQQTSASAFLQPR